MLRNQQQKLLNFDGHSTAVDLFLLSVQFILELHKEDILIAHNNFWSNKKLDALSETNY